MTSAASRFLDEVMVSWDSSEPWENTAALGLSDVDSDALRTYCDESDEDYAEAEAEVLSFVRRKVSA